MLKSRIQFLRNSFHAVPPLNSIIVQTVVAALGRRGVIDLAIGWRSYANLLSRIVFQGLNHL